MKISFQMAKDMGLIPDIYKKVYSRHSIFYPDDAIEAEYRRELAKVRREFNVDELTDLVEFPEEVILQAANPSKHKCLFPEGDKCRKLITLIGLLLGAMVVLFICWVFIVGLWAVIG